MFFFMIFNSFFFLGGGGVRGFADRKQRLKVILLKKIHGNKHNTKLLFTVVTVNYRTH